MSEQTNVIPDTMTAIEITEPGGPEVLKPTTRPVPRPKENEVLIQIAAAGVNGPDVMQRKGQYAPPPAHQISPVWRFPVWSWPSVAKYSVLSRAIMWPR
jgi:hypothetical protein